MRKSKLCILLFLALFSFGCKAKKIASTQHRPKEYLPTISSSVKTHIREVLYIEKNLGANTLDSNVNTFFFDRTASFPGYSFERSNEFFCIPSRTVYNYDKKDSLLISMRCDWDELNLKNLENPNICTNIGATEYINLFSKISEEITRKLKVSPSKSNKQETDSKIEISQFWELDSLTVNNYMIYSDSYKKTGNITTIPTHRVRVTFSWLK